MNDINKQKFLAELSKLLTFMYEEDRLKTMEIYTKMFDEAEDEQMLIQALVSPLRQAVEVARAYNKGDRKLQVESKTRKESGLAPTADDEDFLQTVYQIRADALQAQPKRETVSENQISLFDMQADVLAPAAEAAASFAEETPLAPEAAEAEAPADQADSFIEQTSLPIEADEAPEAPVPDEPASPAPYEESGPVEEALPAPQESVHHAEKPAPTVRKPRVPLLILYILAAIPLAVAGIVLLLLPTFASLGAAGLCIAGGVLVLSSAFGSFSLIADFLVVLGAALVLLALGLLFLWLFVWFIGGAMAGLVHGLVVLGNKWCYKEVPAK